MVNPSQIEIRCPQRSPQIVFGLQGMTLAWMLVECGVSLYAAADAHSVALLAFGADSFVELLSASIVLVSLLAASSFTNERATRWAGILLFALAVIVTATAITALARGHRPESSPVGLAITAVALFIMPGLAWAKRRTAKATENHALAADAVQSATCAYLAAITLVGLAVNVLFHVGWVDSVAALAATPILVIEGWRALRGKSCSCC